MKTKIDNREFRELVTAIYGGNQRKCADDTEMSYQMINYFWNDHQEPRKIMMLYLRERAITLGMENPSGL